MMNTITVNGNGLAFAHYGEGQPVVLIHGFPLDHTIWEEVIGYLQSKCQLIVPDLRGFGLSSTPASSYSMDDMASDIAGLLDHLKLDKVTLIGHSMGGYIGLAFARLYPNRVAGLVLVSSQAQGDSPEQKKGRYETAGLVVEKGVEIVLGNMATKLSADEGIQEPIRKIIVRQEPIGVAGALKAMAERPDSLPVLAGAPFPILIVHGDNDQLIPIERAQLMKESSPAADLITLAGVGHMPMMESASELAKEVIRFTSTGLE
jgi:pimeloyl-ACP methyl ester carboxylesterase